MKKAACIYDLGFNLESGVGALRLYLPANIGYINFNIAHSIKEDRFCDTWRLSKAFAADDDFKNEVELTSTAEWDMALKIKNRDDFIGGYMHGDEKFTGIRLLVDGQEREITTLSELTRFDNIRLQVESEGYDPADHKTIVLKHFKEYIIDANGVSIKQRVEWLSDCELNACYMAMMPPLKDLTDFYYTDVDPTPKAITGDLTVNNCASATLFKINGLEYTMSVPRYPKYDTGNKFLITDNGGNPYNKMYFVVCRDASVKCAEVWESQTEYIIKNNV